MGLELEPLPPGPPPGESPTGTWTDVRAERRARRRAARIARREARERRGRSWLRYVPPMSRSFAISLGAHVVLFAALALLLALRGSEPPERTVAVTIDLRSFVEAADPEATPGGASPVAEAPQGREAGAKAETPGRLFDDEDASATVGAGASVAGSLYLGRTGGKERLLQAGGGDGATEGAVRLALEWLARHQAPDGSWSASGFRNRCPRLGCDGPGEAPYVEATTALALLPFLGAGHTHRAGPWKDTVKEGLRALVALQRADGSFAGDSKRGYATAIGALALAEAYGLTESPSLREPAQRAAGFLVRTQSPSGGWRYLPGDGETDSSVTGWAALALAAARKSGLDVPDRTLGAARAWFANVSDTTGDVGYTGRGGGSAALLGVGAFVQTILGADPASPRLAATFDLLERRPPRLPRGSSDAAEEYGVADPTHWYYGALAAFQRGDGTWKAWNSRLRDVLLPAQVRDETDARGSWDPVGATGRHGGRVVVTALTTLTLEVYYRYPRAAWR